MSIGVNKKMEHKKMEQCASLMRMPSLTTVLEWPHYEKGHYRYKPEATAEV